MLLATYTSLAAIADWLPMSRLGTSEYNMSASKPVSFRVYIGNRVRIWFQAGCPKPGGP